MKGSSKHVFQGQTKVFHMQKATYASRKWPDDTVETLSRQMRLDKERLRESEGAVLQPCALVEVRSIGVRRPPLFYKQ